MTHKTSGREARERRRNLAEQRRQVSEGQSPEERLSDLDARLGSGVGATKERKRIADAIGGHTNKKSKKGKK